jgi:hypothetical protein
MTKDLATPERIVTNDMGRIGTLIALETPTKSHKSRFAKVRWYPVLELRKCLIKAGVDVPGLRKEME